MADVALRVNDEEYQKIRKQALERDGKECADCSYSPKDQSAKELHVHHILPERLFKEADPHRLQNLVTLCSMCHGAWEKEFRAMLEGRPAWNLRVRNRIKQKLGDDVEFPQEHFEEAYDLAVEEICEDGGDDA